MVKEEGSQVPQGYSSDYKPCSFFQAYCTLQAREKDVQDFKDFPRTWPVKLYGMGLSKLLPVAMGFKAKHNCSSSQGAEVRAERRGQKIRRCKAVLSLSGQRSYPARQAFSTSWGAGTTLALHHRH